MQFSFNIYFTITVHSKKTYANLKVYLFCTMATQSKRSVITVEVEAVSSTAQLKLVIITGSMREQN